MERRAAEAVNAALVLTYYRPTTNPGIAIGSTTTKVTLGTTTTYLVNGSFLSKTNTADLWTLSGTTVAAGSVQRYALLLDASGTASAQEGVQQIGTNTNSVTWTNVAGKGKYMQILYWASQGLTLIGSVAITTDATHTFIPGTTALNATGITAAYTSGLDSSITSLIGDLSGRAIGSF